MLAYFARLPALAPLHSDITGTKDPTAAVPKRPPSAFLAYLSRERSVIREAHPGIHNSEVSVIAGRRWRELDPAEKQPLLDAARAELEEYRRKMTAAVAALEEADLIDEYRDTLKGKRICRILRRDKASKIMGYPKKPPSSPLTFYVMENFQVVRVRISRISELDFPGN
jgi:hypothetical protein